MRHRSVSPCIAGWDYKAISVHLQLQLPTGTELGNSSHYFFGGWWLGGGGADILRFILTQLSLKLELKLALNLAKCRMLGQIFQEQNNVHHLETLQKHHTNY